ncbi:MAG: hypothetical protein Q7R91_02360 [bacterium]|nr:hypothetical protein [bacterium]
MKKWVTLGLVLFFIALALVGFSRYVRVRLDERRAVAETRARLETEAKLVSTDRVENIMTKLEKLRRLEDMEEFAVKNIASLPQGERTVVGPAFRVKLFGAYFRRGELLLGRAGDLLRKDENHPTGKEYIERARKIYEKMDKLIDEGVSAHSKDAEENARLNYLKGVYYFRSLVFITDAKAEAPRVEELVGLSAKHLSAVFQYKPKDRDTEVALEILQKKAQQMGAGGDGSGKMQLELLPSQGNNQGPTFSIEGSEGGRH